MHARSETEPGFCRRSGCAVCCGLVSESWMTCQALAEYVAELLAEEEAELLPVNASSTFSPPGG
jgi:glycine/D-amino acid oxidase-like deaminating enzyme